MERGREREVKIVRGREKEEGRVRQKAKQRGERERVKKGMA